MNVDKFDYTPDTKGCLFLIEDTKDGERNLIKVLFFPEIVTQGLITKILTDLFCNPEELGIIIEEDMSDNAESITILSIDPPEKGIEFLKETDRTKAAEILKNYTDSEVSGTVDLALFNKELKKEIENINNE